MGNLSHLGTYKELKMKYYHNIRFLLLSGAIVLTALITLYANNQNTASSSSPHASPLSKLQKLEKGVTQKLAVAKQDVAHEVSKIKDRIVNKLHKSPQELLQELKKIKNEHDVAEFVIKTLDSLSKLEEAVFAPLYTLIKPLPLIPLGPFPFIPILNKIGDIGDLVNDVQIEAHIGSLIQRFKKARAQFDQLTSKKYVTEADIKLAERQEKEEHSLIGKIAEKIEKVTEPMSEVIEKSLHPIEKFTEKLEKNAAFLIKPVVELTDKLPMIPLLGPISTFEYLVHIRGLQQHMNKIEEILAHKLQPLPEKSLEFTSLSVLKANKESKTFAQYLEKILSLETKIESNVDNLLQPLIHFPFLTGFVIKSGIKVTKWAVQSAADVLEVTGAAELVGGGAAEVVSDAALLGGGVTAETGVGAVVAGAGAAGAAASGGVAVAGAGQLGLGVAIDVSAEVLDELITGLIYRTFIRNLEQVLERLVKEIKEEQESQGITSSQHALLPHDPSSSSQSSQSSHEG